MNEQNQVPQVKAPEWIDHPLVGRYIYRVRANDWMAETSVRGLDYPINISAEGSEPSKAQMDRFTELIARLPEIIASSNLPDAPIDEWRDKHPEYRLASARISFCRLYENGSFYFSLIAHPEDDWVPMFDISADFKVTLAEWGV